MSRTIRRTTTIMAAFASAALLLAGCSADGGSEPPTPESPGPESTVAEPAPPPESKSPEDEAIEAAEPLVYEYFRVRNAVAKDAASYPREDLKTVAYDVALMDLENIHALMSSGDRQTGDAVVDSVEVHDTHLDEERPTVRFRACVDSSTVDIVNEAGESKTADRAGHAAFLVTVRNDAHTDGRWLVSTTEVLDRKSC
jgi:hypothetical protein